MNLYHYPQQAFLGRNIPKKKLYKQGKANAKIEQLFIAQVEKITWAYVLSAHTIKLADQADLKEIQIFQIQARMAELDLNILKFIDKLIPSPIIFEVYYQGQVKVVASYKRLNQADKSKTVLNQYYASDWLADDNRVDLPIYLHLADLYEHFIEQLLPIENIGVSSEHSDNNANYKTENKISIEDKLARVQQIENLKKQVAKMQAKVKKETQFNRQVEMNMQLQKLQNELVKLQSSY